MTRDKKNAFSAKMMLQDGRLPSLLCGESKCCDVSMVNVVLNGRVGYCDGLYCVSQNLYADIRILSILESSYVRRLVIMAKAVFYMGPYPIHLSSYYG